MKIKNITLSAMFLAVAYVLPFFTGQIPQIGQMLCPMHVPVLLCGYFCGPMLGAIVGCIAPILRSVTIGMPIIFPSAVCMAFELATYGFVCGLLYRAFGRTKVAVVVSLVAAMIIGRIVWGIAMLACVSFDIGKFGFAAFLAGAVTNAIPGIVLQLVIIPLLVVALRKHTAN